MQDIDSSIPGAAPTAMPPEGAATPKRTRKPRDPAAPVKRTRKPKAVRAPKAKASLFYQVGYRGPADPEGQYTFGDPQSVTATRKSGWRREIAGLAKEKPEIFQNTRVRVYALKDEFPVGTETVTRVKIG